MIQFWVFFFREYLRCKSKLDIHRNSCRSVAPRRPSGSYRPGANADIVCLKKKFENRIKIICIRRKGYRFSSFRKHAKKGTDTLKCICHISRHAPQLNILYSICQILEMQETCRIWFNNISRKRYS